MNTVLSRKILLAEDDVNLGMILTERLNMKGFEVLLCSNGQQAYEAFNENKFDLMILDVMMPVKDGFTLAKEIRTKDDDTPIIFVTARNMKEDILKGLDIGADDYITKPFSMEELMLRIQAILKRSVKNAMGKVDEVDEYEIGASTFNHVFQTLEIGKEKFKLTSKEADLMKILCENKNEVVLREIALKRIWGDDTYFNGRSMDVFISKLRKMLSIDPSIEIMNVHGKGFKLVLKD
jgi:DNA-binding response OmpR family regulator